MEEFWTNMTGSRYSRQPSIDYVRWLLVTTHTDLQWKKSKLGKKKIKMWVWGEKEPKKIIAGAKSCAQRNEKRKERPDAKWILSGIILQPVEGNGPKDFLRL